MKEEKSYRKHIIISISLIILFIVILLLVKQFITSGGKKVINENKSYFYEIEKKTVYLKSSDGLESTYKCKNECVIYSRDNMKGYFYNGKILLQDGIVIYLYDLLNNKKLSANYNWIDYIFDDEGTEISNIKMFKVKDSYSKQGIIDTNGSVLVSVTYDELGKTIDENLLNYSYKKNYITAKSGGKWGLVALNSGKGLIDFQYNDIKISKYGKFAVQEEDLWTVVDESNKKIINKEYSSINILENYLVVSEANKAFIVDLEGNLTSNKIELHYDVDPWASITIKGLTTKVKDKVIYLYVDTPINKDAGTYKSVEYYYDEENNQIISVE